MAEYFTRCSVVLVCAAASLVVTAGCVGRTFDEDLTKGQAALGSGDYVLATKCLRRASRARPSSGQLAFNLGMAELNAGNLGRAAAAFRRAEDKSAGDSIEPLLALARVRHLQRKWKAAARIYDKALEREGRRPDLLAAMAATAYRRGRAESAIELLGEALAQNIDEPAALYNMGCVQRDLLDDKGAAVTYFARFLEVAPATEAPAMERARSALEELGEAGGGGTSARAEELILKSRMTEGDEAVSYAEQAIKEDPLSADAQWNLAVVFRGQGMPDDKINSVYRHFYTLFPKDARAAGISAGIRAEALRALVDRAREAEAAGEAAEAMSGYRRALAADESNHALWLGFSDAAREAGEPERARDAALRALSLRRNDPGALYRLGYLYLQLGDRDEAVSFYKRYIQYAPESEQKNNIRQWLRSLGD